MELSRCMVPNIGLFPKANGSENTWFIIYKFPILLREIHLYSTFFFSAMDPSEKYGIKSWVYTYTSDVPSE